jgi:hypothetical protein
MPIINIKGHKDFVNKNKPSEYIIIFKADWNLPSKAMYAIIDDSASKNKEETFYVFDAEKYNFSKELKDFKVFAFPTVVRVSKGKTIGKAVGTLSRMQFSIFSGLK